MIRFTASFAAAFNTAQLLSTDNFSTFEANFLMGRLSQTDVETIVIQVEQELEQVSEQGLGTEPNLNLSE